MRALIVEDDQSLREQLTNQLRGVGYAVDATGDGEEGLYYVNEFPLDVAIIDLGLPGMSGIELIQRARESGSKVPILILTARGRWQNKVEGLEAGADDYLVKPFQNEELLARLRALVRRSAGWAHPVMACGPIQLDTGSQTVSVSEQNIDLTAYEYKVLEYLMVHAGEVVSKTALSEHIYEDETERDSNVIEVFMRRLRRKLDPDESLQPIETLRGRGYRMRLARSDPGE